MSSVRAQSVLLQPAASGRLSGGYQYNRRMAAAGAWDLVEVTGADLRGALDSTSPTSLVLADSLWLSPTHGPDLLNAKHQGRRLGMVLHAFPSVIAHTDAGRAGTAEPTAFELATLAALDVVVLVGDHYRITLTQAGVRVVTCPPGVDEAFRAPPRTRGERCRFLSVSAVSPLKGLVDAAKVFTAWPQEPAFEWTVIGSMAVDLAYARELQACTRDKAHLRLLGQQSPDFVAAELKRADVLVLPSLSENNPLVVLEAMSASVPIVAYAVGAVPRLLEPPARGLTARVGDIGHLNRHLDSLLRDEAMRLRMAHACHAYASDIPTWQCAAQAARAALAEYAPQR